MYLNTVVEEVVNNHTCVYSSLFSLTFRPPETT